ncbi:hypothetical protein [Halostella pelagica]|uniref:hypothetical protein n=1 Tax=Halostella pelagica TaxID=2583824 RepID=UPI0010805CCE|nr:hypothetical protein [Halostella pelagica]
MVETGTSYFGVRSESHVREDLDRFRERGLDAVLHTFSERDREYYQETMADIVSASHERGFRVYVNPWGVGRVFGGEALSEFIGRHPEACQQLSTGQRLPAACFNHPEFREYMREWSRDAVATGADVVFWDEPHWYIPEWHGDEIPQGAWTCRCSACQDRYEQEYGEEMPAERTDSVDEFREESLLDFFEEMTGVVAAEGAENAVCVLPSDDWDHGLSDWDRLAGLEALDVFATDPYWAIHDHDCAEFVADSTARVTDLADRHDLESQIWVQGFRLDDEAATVEDVATATRAALDGDADSVFMWGYDACESISSIACEDPEAVWESYLMALP